MEHEDQIQFYSCPLCGIGTGNDIDNAIYGIEDHDYPIEKEMRESEINSTFSNAVPTLINSETIVVAIEKLKKYSFQPFAVSVSQSDDLIQTIPELVTKKESSIVSSFHGIPVYKDATVPKGILRFKMSNGDIKDFKFKI